MKKQFQIIQKAALGLLCVAVLTTACKKKSTDDPTPVDNNVTLQKQSLSGLNATPAVTTTASGTVESSYDKGSNKLIITINYYNIAPTLALIQTGYNGVGNGKIVDTLNLRATSPIRDTVTLTASEETDLLDGKLYVNLRSAANADGELRAQLITSDFKLFTNVASGGEEVANVTTSSTSTFYGTFNKSTKVMHYAISYTGETPTAAHIHTEFAGKNGDPKFTLTTPAANNTVTGSTTAFTDDQVKDLEAGKMYYNVHTNTNKGGELRAQLNNGSVSIYTNFILNAGNEAGAVISIATGRGFITYNPSNKTINYTIITKDLNSATAAQIEKADGSKLYTLNTPSAGTGDVYTSGVINGVSNDDATSMKNGDLYVNIRTTSYPNGEIRGVIR